MAFTRTNTLSLLGGFDGQRQRDGIERQLLNILENRDAQETTALDDAIASLNSLSLAIERLLLAAKTTATTFGATLLYSLDTARSVPNPTPTRIRTIAGMVSAEKTPLIVSHMIEYSFLVVQLSCLATRTRLPAASAMKTVSPSVKERSSSEERASR
jgi:hypothetical protein